MKILRLSFFILTLVAVALSSCKKSSDNTTPATSNSATFKFNGTAYAATKVTGAVGSGALQVIGIINSTTSIYIVITGNLAVGSFDLSSGAGSVTFTQGSTIYLSTAGTITVTSLTSSTIAGTFNFTGTNASTGGTGTGTSGAFKTTYTTVPAG